MSILAFYESGKMNLNLKCQMSIVQCVLPSEVDVSTVTVVDVWVSHVDVSKGSVLVGTSAGSS